MNLLETVNKPQLKTKVADVRSGDTVRVHQTIREGNKSRVQVFEGVVIRRQRLAGVGASITVRKISSGIGVEKTWFLHSPNVVKVEVMRRSKVRRALLSYMRARRGKSARLAELEFDREAANAADARTASQVAADDAEQKEAEKPQSDDVLNQPDTESIDKEIAAEEKAAVADDKSPVEDEKTAPAKEAEAGNDRVENDTKN